MTDDPQFKNLDREFLQASYDAEQAAWQAHFDAQIGPALNKLDEINRELTRAGIDIRGIHDKLNQYSCSDHVHQFSLAFCHVQEMIANIDMGDTMVDVMIGVVEFNPDFPDSRKQ